MPAASARSARSPLLGHDRESFWGSHADLTAKIVDEAIADITLRVEAQISAARETFAARSNWFAGGAMQAILEKLGNRRWVSDYEAVHECPACGNQAWLTGETETRWDLASIDTPHGESSAPTVVLYPDRFYCAVCDLSLEDDEIEHAGVETMIELPNGD